MTTKIIEDATTVPVNNQGVRSLFKNDFLSINAVPVKGNEHIIFERNKTNSGAIIVPMTSEGKIMLIKEFRAGIGGFVLSLPKGAQDHPGENPIVVAERELMEELGVSASGFYNTGINSYALPSFTNIRAGVIFAFDCEKVSEPKLDGDEQIEPMGEYTRTELISMIFDGRIQDTESCMAILSIEPALKGKKKLKVWSNK